MQYFLPTLLLTLIGGTALAQTFTIKGKVKDNAGAPLPVATTTLLKAEDSSVVQSVLTEEDGTYQLQAEKGSYLLDIRYTGLLNTRKTLTISGNTTVEDIVLQKQNELKEVTISAQKPYVEQSLGKTTLNIAGSVAGKGSTAYDVLRKAPGVTIDLNGNISMQGKQGVLVMINEKQVYMSGTELMEYLRSIPSDDINKLDLITQPSGKYDAEGNAGIINFALKKNRNEGMNGNVSSTVAYGFYPSTQNHASVHSKHGKLNLNTHAGYLLNTGFIQIKTKRSVTDEEGNPITDFNTGFGIVETLSDYVLRTGADYEFNDKTTAGISIAGVYHPNTEQDTTNSIITDYVTNNTQHNIAIANKGFIRKIAMGNAYLTHKMNDKNEIQVNTEYLYREHNAHLFLMNTNYDVAQQVSSEEANRMLRPFSIEVGNIKADYSGSLPKDVKLEAGVKSSLVTVDNDAQFDIYQNGWKKDLNRSNHFIYHENINAGYTNLAKELGEKWKLQLGLRVEQANINGVQTVNDERLSRHTLSLFPTAFAFHKFSDKHQVEVNYGRRIRRPTYNELNPFTEFYSQYSFATGNPQLRPTFSNNLELKHYYNNLITTTLSYSHSNDIVRDVLTNDPVTKATMEVPQNIGTSKIISASTAINLQIVPWWRLSGNTEAYYMHFDQNLDKEKENIDGWGYEYSIDSQLTMKNGWSAQVQMYHNPYRRNYPYLHRYNPYYSVGVSKKILKDTTTVKAEISDPFYTNKGYIVSDMNNILNAADYKYNTRSFALTVAYSFGKSNNKSQRNNTMEETNRM
jgi:outer membrane receptor protein involved in Fe transport